MTAAKPENDRPVVETRDALEARHQIVKRALGIGRDTAHHVAESHFTARIREELDQDVG